MLAVLFAVAFMGAAVDAEFGEHTATKLFAKGCMAMDGEYFPNARMNTVGNNKEYRDAPSHVPFCSRGPVDLIIDEVGTVLE